MATTIKARAGSVTVFEVQHLDENLQLIDTTGMQARLQLRALGSRGQIVLLISDEYLGTLPAPDGTVLTRIEEGHWEVVLGKSITNRLPSTTAWELELLPASGEENVVTVDYGVIKTEPELVKIIA